MVELSLVQKLAVYALPVLFAITVHEAAHGWAAKQLGDRTAQMLGRLTLNPIKHIDPVGTVLVPGVLLLTGGFLFGWAKPVPISARNFRHPRRDMAIVALAGPMSNVVMALGWAFAGRVALGLSPDLAWLREPLWWMAGAGVSFNLLLAILNLLPILPLDGGRVLNGILPPKLSDRLESLEPLGLPILLVLLVTGILGPLLQPGMLVLNRFVYSVVGV